MRSHRLLDNAASGIDRIAPYQPGAAGAAGRSDFAILASNENPLGCGSLAKEAVRSFGEGGIGRYPDGNAGAIKEALAGHLGVGTGHLILGNGSNEVLELAAQAFLRPGTACVYSRHAFIVYELATLARGARPVVVPDAGFAHDLEAIAAACADPEARVVYIANPNNPTGGWREPDDLLAFLRAVPSGVLVVLDEAYHEYLDEGRGDSIGWIGDFPNLLVTRSFSKIHGLAALRVGYGISSPGLIDLLNRVRQPFNVNAVAQAAAIAALYDEKHVERSRELNRSGLALLEEALDRLGIEHAPTRANFVMARFADASTAHAHLLQDGLLTRPLGGYALADWLRITVGDDDENGRLVRSLERLVQ